MQQKIFHLDFRFAFQDGKRYFQSAQRFSERIDHFLLSRCIGFSEETLATTIGARQPRQQRSRRYIFNYHLINNFLPWRTTRVDFWSSKPLDFGDMFVEQPTSRITPFGAPPFFNPQIGLRPANKLSMYAADSSSLQISQKRTRIPAGPAPVGPTPLLDPSIQSLSSDSPPTVLKGPQKLPEPNTNTKKSLKTWYTKANTKRFPLSNQLFL
jgi:hypothetical protein